MNVEFIQKIVKACEGNSPVNLQNLFKEYKRSFEGITSKELKVAILEIKKTTIIYEGNNVFCELLETIIDSRD